ncbi:Re/Si-specific NAD(P)(+) transhydrogenase subunit alpha [Thermoleptolyngbya sp. C42_A2020_037]|uniref:Re/Si-specific NAD(P)(+) transhydrogenase subunit alpha n=1 Tax=Thermoleptolyngbya sp. C42_A2020_037 TaxID=2747799 RepID=UPI001A03E6AF|nr:Re/Si-specific NAD(P)(+) transhydrogenase subunit alpha [Thermoleptolyngbya sp. C42_A2020_037]MBF2083605.1 Re/Si-specific NAD(P)(+) transhydrogenase subunit alpha [Thermoleptolyngbya sp. C42_A2020_037]
MKIAVAKEIEVGERRVALVPDVVGRLVKQGLEVWVEAGAGDLSHFSDAAYESAGAQVLNDGARLWGEADVVLKVSPPREREDGQSEIDRLRPGAVLISFLNPLGEPSRIQRLAERGVTAISMEMIPRTSRAQSMDALSSQAGVAGYQAALLGAAALPKFFPMLTTAAGTIPPAKVFVMGAGVAGLQAIATCRRLGAVVEAFDIRPAVKEEVQSLGAKFVEVNLEEDTVAEGGYAKEISEAAKARSRQVITEHVKQADVIITTAQVPGKAAPILLTEEMVAQMKPGSVVVDLAAEQGGNCACTEPGKDVVKNGVTIMGPINLPSSLPIHASQMYAKNLTSLLQLMVKDGELLLNFDDDIIASACVAHAGEIRNERVKAALAAACEGVRG